MSTLKKKQTNNSEQKKVKLANAILQRKTEREFGFVSTDNELNTYSVFWQCQLYQERILFPQKYAV